MDPSTDCAVCGIPASLRCARCKVVYCSRAHQALMWPSHKMLCGNDLAFRQAHVTCEESDFFAATQQMTSEAADIVGLTHHAEPSGTIVQTSLAQLPGDSLEVWWNGLNRRISTLSSAQRTEWATSLRVAIAETTPNPDLFVCTHLFPFYHLNKIQPLMSQHGVAHSLQIHTWGSVHLRPARFHPNSPQRRLAAREAGRRRSQHPKPRTET